MNASIHASTNAHRAGVASLCFHNSDFAYNRDLTPRLVDFAGRQLIFVDNAFAHPDRVVAYLNRVTAFKSHKTAPHSRNGIDFLDGQQTVYAGEDPGRDHVERFIAAHYGIPFKQRCHMTFNQFRLLEPAPPDRHWWPHTDDQVNQVTFLNPMHNGRGGTSIYRCRAPAPDGEHEHEKPWRTPEEFEEVLCVRDSYNTLVAFPGNWYHGMKIDDDTFLSNVRYTEVRFY